MRHVMAESSVRQGRGHLCRQRKIREFDDTLGHGEHRWIGRRDFHYPRGSCYRYPRIARVTTRLELPATLHTTPRYLALSVSSICRRERGPASYGGAADVANCIQTVCAKLAYSRPLASLRANAAAAARSFAWIFLHCFLSERWPDFLYLVRKPARPMEVGYAPAKTSFPGVHSCGRGRGRIAPWVIFGSGSCHAARVLCAADSMRR